MYERIKQNRHIEAPNTAKPMSHSKLPATSQDAETCVFSEPLRTHREIFFESKYFFYWRNQSGLISCNQENQTWYYLTQILIHGYTVICMNTWFEPSYIETLPHKRFFIDGKKWFLEPALKTASRSTTIKNESFSGVLEPSLIIAF